MNQSQAINIAIDVLYQEIEIPEEDEIIPTHVEEHEEGWYIECNSRLFLETDNPLYALVTAPLMIYRDGTYRFIF